MNKLILKFIFLFTPLLERAGVDTKQLEIILSTKLTMDDRRPFAFSGRRQKQNADTKNSSLGAMFFLVLMGCFFCFFLYRGQQTIFGNVLYISMFMIIISITLVADFTSVLIDVRDNFIILPRPVTDRTFTVSRILHIAIHVFKMVIALSLPAIIFQGYFHGITGVIAFFIEIQLASVFGIFLVNLLYLAVLKYSSPQQFNNVISYFQIVFSVLVFAAYQVLPRIGMLFDLNAIDPLTKSYSFLLPPVWFASFFDATMHPRNVSGIEAIFAVLGLVAPFLALWFVISVLAPGFNRRLSSITPNGEENSVKVKPGQASSKPVTGGLAEKLSVAVSRNLVEQAGFKLTWWLTSRYRDFKIKVYPSFAFVPVYFVYFVFIGTGRKHTTSLDDLRQGSGFIMLMYLTAFVLISVLQQISQSEKYKAAWIMFSTSHNEPGKLLSGMYKAIICKYFFPFYLVISAFGIFLWGPSIINDLLLGFFNLMIYGLIIALFTVEYLPFSKPISNQGGRSYKQFLIMFVLFIIGGLHYALRNWEWAIDTWLVLSATGCYFLFNHFRNRDWMALEADYS